MSDPPGATNDRELGRKALEHRSGQVREDDIEAVAVACAAA